MIKFTTGDILQEKLLVVPVNCVGPCGAGLAKAVADKYNWFEPKWKFQCRHNEVSPGSVFIYTADGVYLFAMATKKHWQNPSKLQWVVTGLESLAITAEILEVDIAVPKVGCGHGGLKWEVVKPQVEMILGKSSRTFLVYE